MKQGWIGFDLDGTLATYTTWEGYDKIGEPVPKMINLVKELLQQGVKIKILTARVSTKVPPDAAQIAKTAIKEWCLKHLGKALPVTAEKDFSMIECYDDRAITVEFNTGNILVKNRDLVE